MNDRPSLHDLLEQLILALANTGWERAVVMADGRISLQKTTPDKTPWDYIDRLHHEQAI